MKPQPADGHDQRNGWMCTSEQPQRQRYGQKWQAEDQTGPYQEVLLLGFRFNSARRENLDQVIELYGAEGNANCMCGRFKAPEKSDENFLRINEEVFTKQQRPAFGQMDNKISRNCLAG